MRSAGTWCSGGLDLVWLALSEGSGKQEPYLEEQVEVSQAKRETT